MLEEENGMARFSKQATCPTAATLAAYHADQRPLLAQQATEAHLSGCDFCGAELQLLARGAAAPQHTDAQPLTAAPPLPLALRLYAETMLGAAAVKQPRAA
jgi:hypothetical protein